MTITLSHGYKSLETNINVHKMSMTFLSILISSKFISHILELDLSSMKDYIMQFRRNILVEINVEFG